MYYATNKNYTQTIITEFDKYTNKSYLRLSNNIIFALINCFDSYHVLFSVHLKSNKILMIEHYDNAIKEQYDKSAYIYIIDNKNIKVDTELNNIFSWYPKYDIFINNNIKYEKKYKIKSVYNYLIDAGIIIISFQQYEFFLMKYIPKNIFDGYHSEKYLYHGSNINIKDTYLKPQYGLISNGKPLIYATSKKTDAMTFFNGVRIPINFGWGYYNNYVILVEKKYNIFKKLFDNVGYLYVLNKNKLFKPTYLHHYISDTNVTFIKKIIYKNAYNALLKRRDFILIKYNIFNDWIKSFV